MPRQLTPASDARAVAHATLLRIRRDGAFADIALAHALGTARLSGADAAFATQLVYGVVAWQGRLDHHLGQLVRQPLASLDDGVREALQLGLFQLLFLRVAAHAAVDTSVALARRGAGAGAAGLVNAVLRRVAAGGPTLLTLPSVKGDPLARLAVEWSHPQWLVERWANEFGIEQLPALLAAHNAPGEITLRTNLRRTSRDALASALAAAGVPTHPARFAPAALVVDGHAAHVRTLTSFRDGACSFQGEVSQLVVDLLDPQPGERVLDACAAPGGKATAIAERVGPTGQVVATDLRYGGARSIRIAAARLGVAIDPLVVNAAVATLPLAPVFDRVLIDAPCSGLGTLRRHPEVRWRRTPADVATLAELQLTILQRVARLVKPSGTAVYAVCTRTHEETDGVIAAFLHATPEWRLVAPAPHLPAAVLHDRALRTMPFTHNLDGFFAVRLQRRS